MILAGVLIGEHGFHVLDRDSSFELFVKWGFTISCSLPDSKWTWRPSRKPDEERCLRLAYFPDSYGAGYMEQYACWDTVSLPQCCFASMYASHTLIAYPIISRYGLSRLRSVNITIGGTAITVTLALIILAVIGGMFKGTVDGLFWVFLVAKVAFLGFLIIFFFPRIGRWFFRKYDDSVMQFVFVLAMVFLGGGLMEFVGMEGILGAFLPDWS